MSYGKASHLMFPASGYSERPLISSFLILYDRSWTQRPQKAYTLVKVRIKKQVEYTLNLLEGPISRVTCASMKRYLTGQTLKNPKQFQHRR